MEPCPVSMHTGNGTFRALADRLRSLGWMDTIPLEGKRPLVSRRHGTARKHVSGFDLDEWQSLYPNANVGIVLPTLDAGDMMVMAIDVDSAAGHERKEDGAVVLTALERELGPLPATWTNGHTDPPYRHLLYRMPNVPHLTAPGAGLDLIWPGNRYIVAPGSVHPCGERYFMAGPDGRPCEPPRPQELPMLPNKWVARLTAFHSAVHNDMMATDPEEWLSLTDDRTPCPYMRGLAHNWASNPCLHQSCRHDGFVELSVAALHAMAKGHTGGMKLIRSAMPRFVRLVAGDRAGGIETAEQEAKSIAVWAIGHCPPPQSDMPDPCRSRMGSGIAERLRHELRPSTVTDDDVARLVSALRKEVLA